MTVVMGPSSRWRVHQGRESTPEHRAHLSGPEERKHPDTNNILQGKVQGLHVQAKPRKPKRRTSTNPVGETPLEMLPVEVFLIVAGNVSAMDMLKLLRVSKTLRATVSENMPSLLRQRQKSATTRLTLIASDLTTLPLDIFSAIQQYARTLKLSGRQNAEGIFGADPEWRLYFKALYGETHHMPSRAVSNLVDNLLKTYRLSRSVLAYDRGNNLLCHPAWVGGTVRDHWVGDVDRFIAEGKLQKFFGEERLGEFFDRAVERDIFEIEGEPDLSEVGEPAEWTAMIVTKLISDVFPDLPRLSPGISYCLTSRNQCLKQAVVRDLASDPAYCRQKLESDTLLRTALLEGMEVRLVYGNTLDFLEGQGGCMYRLE